MSRSRVINYLKKLGLLLSLALLIFVALKLVSSVIINRNNTAIVVDEKTKEKNTAIFQDANLSNEEIKGLDEFIYNFIQLCNEKKYQEIYDCISDNYKNRFNFTIDDVKKFCDREFEKYKLYDYQNNSIINNKVVYDLRIYDDIMSTGVNSFDDYKYNVLKVVITKAIDGTYKISLDGYIDTVTYDKQFSNDQYDITVKYKDIYYEYEQYKIEVYNKSDNECIYLFKDYILSNVKLITKYSNSQKEYDCKTTLNPFISNLLIYPNAKKDFDIKFDRYYDTINSDISNTFVIKDFGYISYYVLDNIRDVDELKNAVLNSMDTVEIELNK